MVTPPFFSMLYANSSFDMVKADLMQWWWWRWWW